MNRNIKSKILKIIENNYLESMDFNGYPINNILKIFKLDKFERNKILIELIYENKISLNFGDIHENAYIKAFQEEKSEIQIEKLNSIDTIHTCAYPTSQYLIKVAGVKKYSDKPFTKKLALGEPQLSFESFDLAVLENYRNDPRYSYYNDDISGHISVHNKYYESSQMKNSDEIFLQSFGFSHNSKGYRAVAVCLRYLSLLSSEHQYIWCAKRLNEEYKIHPDYIKIMLGDWDLGISIFSAFLIEMREINKLCKMMGRQPFLNNEISEENKPKEFSFLIRPTSKEFNEFIMILDKLISENINKKFFKNDIIFDSKEKAKNGKVYIKEKGTIKILDEWLDKLFYKLNDKPHKDFVKLFREIRKLRQTPAHKLDDNIFDQEYYKKQKDIIEKAYRGLQAIRIIFSSNPKCKDYRVPEELEKGTIWVN